MSKYTFTDRSDELYSATLYGDVLELTREPEGEHVSLRFWAVDAEKIVKIIRQAAGTGYYEGAPELDEDACDQSDPRDQSDPTTAPDCPTTLAYRKVALDAALDYTSKASWPGVNVTDIITTAARFEKFLFEGATK